MDWLKAQWSPNFHVPLILFAVVHVMGTMHFGAWFFVLWIILGMPAVCKVTDILNTWEEQAPKYLEEEKKR